LHNWNQRVDFLALGRERVAADAPHSMENLR
jgi:hypothetical protein